MIKYIEGDLFDTKCDIIAHGCNCRGGFGSGVAYTMSKVYPKARNYYIEKFEDEGWSLGNVQFVIQNDGKYIANCATQYNYLPRGYCHVNYDAVEECMEKVRDFAKAKNLSIAIPKIGAGLAGGDWNKVEERLKKVFSDYDVTVYYMEPVKLKV